jgi:hypothetical protein
MRSKVTVVLLFLNVVLFSYIYFYDAPHIDEQKNIEARRRVLPTEIATMDSFSRISRTGETVRIKRRADDSWWLTAPYEWPANPNAVSRIHNELQFLENKTSFPVDGLARSNQSLADFGLAEPAMTIEFTSAGSADKSFKLEIGANTPAENNLYILSPDKTRIHVVNRSLAETVGLPLADLRADSIFTIKVFEVRSLNLQTTTPANIKVRLRRDNASRWSFESPIQARASRTAVEVTINALNALTAKNFPDIRNTDLDRVGLASPTLRVSLQGNARTETLLLGNPVTTPAEGDKPAATEYYAKIEDKPVVFTTTVPAALETVLRAAQEELRDARVVEFDPATVTAVTLVAPGLPELSLQKLESAAPAPANSPASTTGSANDGWQAVTRTSGQAPVTLAADPAVVTGLLQKIQQLAARDRTLPDGQKKRGFLTDAPSTADIERFGFNRPERTITLSLSTGGGLRGNEPTTLTLEIGVSPDQPGSAFARVTNLPFVYEIVPDIIDEAPVLARHYRLRLLRELPENARITALSLVNLVTGKTVYTQKLNDSDKNWDAALAVEPEAGRKALATILAQLRSLRARGFTADSFNPEHADTARGPQPWKYRIDYTVSFNGGADAAQSTPSRLFLTERLGGNVLIAGTDEFGGATFAVTQELLDAVFAITYVAVNDPGPVTPPATATPPEPVPAKPAVPSEKPAGAP